MNNKRHKSMISRIIALVFLAGVLFSCENGDWEFDDYKYQLVYFPYQSPARTLLLGNYDQGFNENDNNHSFEIGVVMSGVYENTTDRKVYFSIDKSLLDTVANVKALPASYYTLETISPVVIPAGEMNGRIKVKLNDAFFEDSLSFYSNDPVNRTNWVIPIIITEVENIDSVASGKPAVMNALRVIKTDWEVAPMDYTLFGINYKNKYHARYLRRGFDLLGDGPEIIDSTIYRAKYVESDEIVTLYTAGYNKVLLEQFIRRGQAGNAGEITLVLDFDNDGNCTVSGLGDNPFKITGSGRFVEGGDAFGGKKRDVIFLDYNYVDFTNLDETHAVKDTLVVRDRAAKFESFDIMIKGGSVE
jgi:hypothetical protein